MDKEKIEAGVRLILEGIGENPDREGLLDTPDRIARMYEEIFGGLTHDSGRTVIENISCERQCDGSRKRYYILLDL